MLIVAFIIIQQTSPEASIHWIEWLAHFGTLLGGLAAIYGIIYAKRAYKTWKSQKGLERRSDQAGMLLKEIVSFEIEIEKWLDNINKARYYQNPKEIKNEKKREKLQKIIKEDTREVSNYEEKGYKLLEQIKFIRAYAENFDPEIVKAANLLEKFLKEKVSTFNEYVTLNRPYANLTNTSGPPSKQWHENFTKAYEILNSKNGYSVQINKIKQLLGKHLFFE